MFGWDDAFLLAMGAAGAIVNGIESSKQRDLIRQGRELEQSAIDTNLEAIRAQNSQASLEAIKELRSNVSSQIAINAARGTASGGGSAAASITKAEHNYSSDENTRRINLMMKENELRAAGVLSGLHTLTSETKLGQSLTNQIFQTIPVSTLASHFKSSPKKEKAGYGLESV